MKFTNSGLIITIICVSIVVLIFSIFGLMVYKRNKQDIIDGLYDTDIVDKIIKNNDKKKRKKTKFIKTLRKCVSSIVFIFVLGVFGFSVYSKATNNNIVVGDTSLIVIATGSMSYKNDANDYLLENNLDDQIGRYDLIGIEKCHDQKDIKKYDIVAFKAKSGITVIHRVIEVDKSGKEYKYVTRGDANSTSDPDAATPLYDDYLKFDDIVGKYNGFDWRNAGSFIMFLQSGSGMATIVGLFYLMILFDIIASKKSKIETERANKLIKILPYKEEGSSQAVKKVYLREVLVLNNCLYFFYEGNFVEKDYRKGCTEETKDCYLIIYDANTNKFRTINPFNYKSIVVKDINNSELNTIKAFYDLNAK